MKGTILALFVAGGLGVTGFLMAGDGTAKEGCPLSAAKASAGGSCCAGKSGGELAAFPSYQRANELLKSWQEVPAKLAAMNDSDKAELGQAMEKMHAIHPAATAFQPTMAFVNAGMAALAEIDAAAAKLCAEHCQTQAKTASAEGSEVKDQCPTVTAAMASAKQKMERSAALVAKANELALVAFKPAAEGGCSGKSACTETAAKLASADEKACCKGEKAALAAAEVKSEGGCSKTQVTLASAEGSACQKGEKASLASAEGKACCKDGKATLAAAEAKSEGGCSKTEATLASAEGSACQKGEKASLASAEGKACCKGEKAAVAAAEVKSEGGCGKTQATAALASADEKPCCVKTLGAKAAAVVAQSGSVLAHWQGAGIRLAALDKADREAAEQVAQTVMTRCPMGSRMPETLDSMAALLRDAAALSAQAGTECQKHEALAKMISPEAKELCQARSMVLAAMVNVLEKSNQTMRSARQLASAN